jgi:hypothetical protein
VTSRWLCPWFMTPCPADTQSPLHFPRDPVRRLRRPAGRRPGTRGPSSACGGPDRPRCRP